MEDSHTECHLSADLVAEFNEIRIKLKRLNSEGIPIHWIYLNKAQMDQLSNYALECFAAIEDSEKN